MKRFTTLALVVFALAAVPAAFADDTAPPTRPADTTATRSSGRAAATGNARMRVELLRLRLEIVNLRFRLHCGPNGKASGGQVPCPRRADARAH